MKRSFFAGLFLALCFLTGCSTPTVTSPSSARLYTITRIAENAYWLESLEQTQYYKENNSVTYLPPLKDAVLRLTLDDKRQIASITPLTVYAYGAAPTAGLIVVFR